MPDWDDSRYVGPGSPAGAALVRTSLPTDGWVKGRTRAPSETYLLERSLGDSPLQVGDVLLAIDGHSVAELRSFALRLRPYQPGESAWYTVLRGSQPVEVEVALHRGRFTQLFAGMPEPYRLLLVPVLLGTVLVFLLRPRDPATRLFFLISIVQVGTVPHRAAGPTDLFYSLPFWAGTVLTALLTIFAGPLFLHLYLLFPTPKRFVARHPRLTAALLYLTGPVICLGAVLRGGIDSFWAFYLQYERVLYLVSQLVVPAVLIHSWLTNRERGARLKVEWLAASLLLSGLGGLLLNRSGEGPFAWLLALGLNLLSPLVLGLAVLGALPRLEQACQQLLIWGLLLGLLGGLYWLIDQVIRLGASLRGEPFPVSVTSLVSALFTALFFQPLRVRIQRAVTSLWEGDRQAAYATLTALSGRLGATIAPAETLEVIVETVVSALALEYAAIELISEGQVIARQAHGTASAALQSLPITYRSEAVGRLLLAERPLLPTEQRLLGDLIGHAGAALYAVRLTADLQRSRQRLVNAREEERRRLHRELHDGLGPQLAGLTLMLEGAGNRLAHVPEAAGILQLAAEQIQSTVAEVRQVVYALRPPALDELGLVGALGASLLRHQEVEPRIQIEAPATLPPLLWPSDRPARHQLFRGDPAEPGPGGLP